jgi:DNA segregation ATPase FtsK/SpoIIIE-like protein
MTSKKTYFIDVENVGSKMIEQFLTQDKTSDVVVVTGPKSNFKASGAILEELSKGKNSRVDVIHTDISRDQLADKLLLIKVGEYRGRFPNRSLIIVSKDKGFKDAADIMNTHWGSNIQTRADLPVVNKKTQPQKKAQPQPQKKAQPQPQKKAQPQPQKKAQPQPQKKAQPQPQKKAQPQPQKKAQPQPQKKAQPQKKEQTKAKKGEWKKYWEIISKRPKAKRPKTLKALISSISNISKTGIEAEPEAVIHGLKSSQKISVKNENVTWLD